MSDKNYDPTNIQQYFGKELITQNSIYRLSPEGYFKGRPGIDGARIKLIAGIEHKHYSSVFNSLYRFTTPELKKELENLIKKEGQEVKPGLHVVISLTEESTSATSRNGFITSLIKEIK